MPSASFDSHFQKGFNSATSPSAFVSNAGTVPGTLGGTNRVLIAYAGFDTTAAALGTVAATWAGAAMTLINSIAAPAGTYILYQFGLIAPTVGNQTLSVTWTLSVSPALSLSGVCIESADQSTGWANAGTDTGTGTSASSAVTTTSGDFALVGHLNDNATGTTIATGTTDFIETSLNGNYAGARNAAVGASTTVAWTLASSVAWANAKVSVLQLAGGGGGRTALNTRSSPLGTEIGMNWRSNLKAQAPARRIWALQQGLYRPVADRFDIERAA